MTNVPSEQETVQPEQTIIIVPARGRTPWAAVAVLVATIIAAAATLGVVLL